MSDNSSGQKITWDEFKNILASELDYLGVPKEEWTQYLIDLIRDSSNGSVKERVN